MASLHEILQTDGMELVEDANDTEASDDTEGDDFELEEAAA
jgi:hypothetical protein